MSHEEELVKICNLKKWFPVRTGFFKALMPGERRYLKAVDGVTFNIKKGEIFGLAGESGCGKTTAAKVILRLLEPTEGNVYFKGEPVFTLGKKEMKKFRSRAQIIYQDPYDSLDPRMTVFNFVAEPLIVHKIGNVTEKVAEALQKAELTPPDEFFHRFPHELSGGQRQRVAIARTLILNPKFIVADEPVSMLDVSIRSSILQLLLTLRDELGISYLYITHDLATARQLCDRIAIMYLGVLVEVATMDELVRNPLHPYSQALMAAVPVPDPTAEKSRATLAGEVPSPVNVPPGCRFHPRCPLAKKICRKKAPELVEVERNHWVACHLRAK